MSGRRSPSPTRPVVDAVLPRAQLCRNRRDSWRFSRHCTSTDIAGSTEIAPLPAPAGSVPMSSSERVASSIEDDDLCDPPADEAERLEAAWLVARDSDATAPP